MDVPKLLVITIAIVAISILMLDISTATILKDKMRDEIERHMLDSMEESIHLGELRKGNFKLDETQFINSWQTFNDRPYSVNARVNLNSPALVTVEGVAKVNHFSRWFGVSETPVTVKYVGIAYMREEGVE